MKHILLSIAVLLLPSVPFTLHAQYHSEVWNPDQGNGHYVNPVLYADYSDPDAIAVGNDYYLTASSFNCIPGLPILHSRDLVNWEIVGHALQALTPDSLFSKPQHGKGVWAPALRYHNGQYYIYWGDPDNGIFMVKSDNPRQGWSQPLCVIRGKGMIDPCPLWDDDGCCYLVNAWSASRSGINSVLTLRELSADGTRVIGNPTIVFDGGQQNHTTEGPKLYKRDGWYWILCPAGDVTQGWQLAMRSRHLRTLRMSARHGPGQHKGQRASSGSMGAHTVWRRLVLAFQRQGSLRPCGLPPAHHLARWLACNGKGARKGLLR